MVVRLYMSTINMIKSSFNLTNIEKFSILH